MDLIKEAAFDENKRIFERDTLSTYPDFNERFKIHTDARASQIEEAIGQKGKPISLYGRKLSNSQKRYTVT